MPAAPAAAERAVAELAGLRRRLASMLYECLLLLGVLALTFLVPYLMLGVAAGIAPPGWFAWLHIFVVLGGYFVWYWTRHGQTLAMQTWRLRIVNAADGRSPGAAQGWLLRAGLALGVAAGRRRAVGVLRSRPPVPARPPRADLHRADAGTAKA